MATIFILIVLAYFVIVSDVSTIEKFVVTLLWGIVALLPNFIESSRLFAAIAQGAIGVYVCLRMTYVRSKA